MVSDCKYLYIGVGIILAVIVGLLLLQHKPTPRIVDITPVDTTWVIKDNPAK